MKKHGTPAPEGASKLTPKQTAALAALMAAAAVYDAAERVAWRATYSKPPPPQAEWVERIAIAGRAAREAEYRLANAARAWARVAPKRLRAIATGGAS